MAELHGQGEGDDEVDQREGDREAEADRIAVQLDADADQAQGREAEDRDHAGQGKCRESLRLSQASQQVRGSIASHLRIWQVSTAFAVAAPAATSPCSRPSAS
jgi:hypothetical protein